MSSKLDNKFGSVGRKSGLPVRELELKHQPKSKFKLSNTCPLCKKQIGDLIEFAKMSGVSVLANSFRLIWGVNRKGEIYVSFEELASSSSGLINAVYNSKMNLKDGNDKLGHPSLLDDKEARISGELYLDNAAWVINNGSGRFGYIGDRCIDHLNNVANEFNNVGLRVSVDFTPPEGK